MHKITFSFAALATVTLAGCTGSIVDTAEWPRASETPTRVDAYYALPRGYLALDLSCKDDGSKLTVTPEKQPVTILPDIGNFRFQLNYNHNFASNDTVTIQLSQEGLLQSVNATSEFQPTQIAAAFAKLVTTVTSPIPLGRREKKPVCPAGKSTTALFDVADMAHGHKLSVLQEFGVTVSPITGPPAGPTNPVEVLPNGVKAAPGIYYRPARLYTLEVSYKSAGDTTEDDTYYVVAPDPYQLFYIPFNRKLFTKFNVQLGFDRGMLTKFQSTDDSEVLGLLQMPADVIKSLLGLSGGGSSAAPAKPAK